LENIKVSTPYFWNSNGPTDPVCILNDTTMFLTAQITVNRYDDPNTTVGPIKLTCNGKDTVVNPGSAAICASNQNICWAATDQYSSGQFEVLH
jgi:hypothetical protein